MEFLESNFVVSLILIVMALIFLGAALKIGKSNDLSKQWEANAGAKPFWTEFVIVATFSVGFTLTISFVARWLLSSPLVPLICYAVITVGLVSFVKWTEKRGLSPFRNFILTKVLSRTLQFLAAGLLYLVIILNFGG